MRRRLACATLVALAGWASPGLAATTDEVEAPLAERLRAAPLIVEGEALQSYAAWDGSDPSSIVTYTPFAVQRVLKGESPGTQVLLRQPGGAIGGAERSTGGAAEFEAGERAFVLLGAGDPKDGSTEIAGGVEGKYRISVDADGRAGLDVRLGVDAGAFSSKEKAPGTLLARVPIETFVRLARDPESRTPDSAATTRVAITLPPPAAAPAHASPARVGVGALALVVAALIAIGVRRRRTSRSR